MPSPRPSLPQPPSAPRRPHTRSLHGEDVADDYAWMRRVDDPHLTAYLEQENAHTRAATGHLAALRATLERELASLLPDDDVSPPWRRGGWVHRTRRTAGQQYAVHVRSPEGFADPAEERVLLDENELAAGHDFVELGVCEVSPDGRLLAYSTDFDGSEVYTLRFRDLTTGTDLPDTVERTYYGLAWSADSGSVFYTTLDDAYRPDTVRRHVLGTSAGADRVVWHEDDRRFELDVSGTRSGAYVRLVAASRDTSEVRLVDAARPDVPPVLVEPRRQGHEYAVEHQPGPDGGRLLVVTDDCGPEFRLVEAPVASPGRDHWREVLPHRPDTRVVDVDAFGDHLVVTERHGGRRRLRVLDRAGATLRLVEPDGPGESVRLGRTEEWDVTSFRVVREGWVRPPVDLEHDLASGAEQPVHQAAVGPGYSSGDYDVEVVQVRAEDGALVPLTLVSRPGTEAPGACVLAGYGAYESSIDPEFRPELAPLMPPLLDRGVLVAVAHVRGGGEGGRTWWQQGRLLRKRTSFTDFVACARWLVSSGRAVPGRLAARGLSAGGLLVGSAAHLAPDLFELVVAEVPFVDVVNSMLDDSLPLTVNEWEEWGNPSRPDEYAYLRSYSPYENLPGPRRPALLVTASRHDPRVSVHEPAKWVAAIRAEDAALTDGQRPTRPLLLHTLMGGGAHTGPAGRYDARAHEAFLHAVTLDRIAPASGAADPVAGP